MAGLRNTIAPSSMADQWRMPLPCLLKKLFCQKSSSLKVVFATTAVFTNGIPSIIVETNCGIPSVLRIGQLLAVVPMNTGGMSLRRNPSA